MLEQEGRGGYTASGPVVLGGEELLLELPAQGTTLVSDMVGHPGANSWGEEGPWVQPRVVSG